MADPLAIQPSPRISAFVVRTKTTVMLPLPKPIFVIHRHPPPPPPVTITIEMVREIRKRFITPPHPKSNLLAQEYGISVTVVRSILQRRSWPDPKGDALLPLFQARSSPGKNRRPRPRRRFRLRERTEGADAAVNPTPV
jgi:hypothetical protein